MEGEPEEDILNEMNKFMDSKGRHSGVTLKVQKPKHPRPLRQQELSWFNPVVMNHVERFHNKKQQWDPNNKLEGWSICFESTADEQIHIAYDIVLVSENPADDDETGGAPLKKHLTPLEEELAGSISAAQSILNEMRYMEKREARMRLTADSINDRIRYFSYISIGVLLTITYLQVSYLKRYFKKKKLM